MLPELDASDFDCARGLFAPFAFRLDCTEALSGTGRLWVDDEEAPRAAFLAASWSYFLAGEPSDEFCAALNRLIRERIYREDPMGHGRNSVRIIAEADVWDEAMEAVLAGRAPIRARRRSYVYDLANDPPAFPLPDGCVIRTLDRDLLDDPSIEVHHQMVVVPMESSHGSVERFLDECFMSVAVMNGRTVAMAVANHLVAPLCELGVSTVPSCRRQGLGVATTAAALRLARDRGFAQASWQCGERNPGSWRIAEKVGFSLQREYTGYMAVGDEKIHAEVLGQWREGRMVF
jgi:GNAT superfamily N-acetyltransferase